MFLFLHFIYSNVGIELPALERLTRKYNYNTYIIILKMYMRFAGSVGNDLLLVFFISNNCNYVYVLSSGMDAVVYYACSIIKYKKLTFNYFISKTQYQWRS